MWKTEHTAVTTATPEAVWRVVAEVERWGTWNPGYRGAGLDGPPRSGTGGWVMLANGLRRPFMLLEATPSRAFVIGANGPGVRQQFLHTIEALPTGGARVSMAATMDGPLTPIFSRIFGRVMASYYPTAVRQLVERAEGAPRRDA